MMDGQAARVQDETNKLDHPTLALSLRAAFDARDEKALLHHGQQMRESFPLDRNGYLFPSWYYREKQDYAQARAFVAQAMARSPDHISFHQALTRIATEEGKLDEAIGHCEHLMRRWPDNVVGYTGLANVLKQQMRFGEALAILSRASQLFPNDITVPLTLARLHGTRADNEAAVAAYHAALAIDPKSKAGRTGLIAYLLRQRKFAEAEPILHGLCADFPEEARFRADLDLCAKSRVTLSKSLGRIKDLSSLEATTVEEDMLVGDTLWQAGSARDALPRYRSALARDPRHATALGRCCEASFIAQEVNEACDLWSTLLDIDSRQADVALFAVERASQGAPASEKIAELSHKTRERLRQRLFSQDAASPKRPRSIALVGGSNTIINFGWAPAFIQSLRGIGGIDVYNHGLGGMSSLYGLAIIKDLDLFAKHDLIIFEYTLNDIYHHEIGTFEVNAIAGLVREVGRLAAEAGSQVIFLLMTGFSNFENVRSGKCAVTRAYEEQAIASGMRFINASSYLRDIPSKFVDAAYMDDLHYSGPFARMIGDEMIVSIMSGKYEFDSEVDRSLTSSVEIADYTGVRLVRPEEFVVRGDSELLSIQTRLISGKFLRLDTSASMSISFRGQVLGILINASVRTGYIKVKFGAQALTKCVFTGRNTTDATKPRVVLRQFTTVLKSDSETVLEITPRVEKSDLRTLPLDRTAYPANPECGLEDQQLEIAAVLIVDKSGR